MESDGEVTHKKAKTTASDISEDQAALLQLEVSDQAMVLRQEEPAAAFQIP